VPRYYRIRGLLTLSVVCPLKRSRGLPLGQEPTFFFNYCGGPRRRNAHRESAGAQRRSANTVRANAETKKAKRFSARRDAQRCHARHDTQPRANHRVLVLTPLAGWSAERGKRTSRAAQRGAEHNDALHSFSNDTLCLQAPTRNTAHLTHDQVSPRGAKPVSIKEQPRGETSESLSRSNREVKHLSLYQGATER
jgi:hypothetical protein